jgi:hypothetical protein
LGVVSFDFHLENLEFLCRVAPKVGDNAPKSVELLFGVDRDLFPISAIKQHHFSLCSGNFLVLLGFCGKLLCHGKLGLDGCIFFFGNPFSFLRKLQSFGKGDNMLTSKK